MEDSSSIFNEVKVKNSISYNDIKSKYYDRTPVIIRSCPFEIEKKKYLVQSNMTIGQFGYYLRKTFSSKISYRDSLIIYINNKIPRNDVFFSTLENNNFVMVDLYKESTFG